MYLLLLKKVTNRMNTHWIQMSNHNATNRIIMLQNRIIMLEVNPDHLV